MAKQLPMLPAVRAAADSTAAADSAAGTDSTAGTLLRPSVGERSAASSSGDAVTRDRRGRPLGDLRISVTDRCNFRCTYCMPREKFGTEYPFLARAELLSYEEITRVARVFKAQGVRKLRITGGEPLLRRDLPELVHALRSLDQELPGAAPLDIALTTNGVLLPALAAPLKAAGLSRVTVSLDSLDQAVFQRMTDSRYRVEQVLAGIQAAADAGLGPIKVNAVIRAGENKHSVLELARHFRGTGHVVRFIEFMDVGTTNGWRLDQVVSAAEIVELIQREYPLEPVDPHYPGEVAGRYRYRDGNGEIGVISSVTQPFCGQCSRARLSSEGTLYTCLFSGAGVGLKALLRQSHDDVELAELIRRTWQQRADRYSEERRGDTPLGAKVEMSHIGG